MGRADNAFYAKNVPIPSATVGGQGAVAGSRSADPTITLMTPTTADASGSRQVVQAMVKDAVLTSRSSRRNRDIAHMADKEPFEAYVIAWTRAPIPTEHSST